MPTLVVVFVFGGNNNNDNNINYNCGFCWCQNKGLSRNATKKQSYTLPVCTVSSFPPLDTGVEVVCVCVCAFLCVRVFVCSCVFVCA